MGPEDEGPGSSARHGPMGQRAAVPMAGLGPSGASSEVSTGLGARATLGRMAARVFRVKVYVEGPNRGPTREDVRRGFTVEARNEDLAKNIARATLEDNRAIIRGMSHAPGDVIVARVAHELRGDEKPSIMVATVATGRKPRR